MESITKVLDKMVIELGIEDKVKKYEKMDYDELKKALNRNIEEIVKSTKEIKAIQNDFRTRIREGYYE